MKNNLLKGNTSSDCVVIPAYKPANQLIPLVSALKEKGYFVLLVDDGSGKNFHYMWDMLSEDAEILHHEKNCGKGAALKTAFRHLQENHPEVSHIVTADADGQHDPRDIRNIMLGTYINPGNIILGCRQFDRTVPFKSRAGNQITRKVFFLVSGCHLEDTQTGLRGFTAPMLSMLLAVQGMGYEYEMNVLLYAAKQSIEISQIPIETIYIDEKNSTSHFHPLRDSIRIYQTIFKFASVSFISFILDYFLFALLLLAAGSSGGAVFFSNVAARIISGGFNYYLNSSVVFSGKQSTSSTLPKYILLALFILCANNVILFLFTDIAGITPYVAKILTESVLFILSFLIQSLVIFHPQKTRQAALAGSQVKQHEI